MGFESSSLLVIGFNLIGVRVHGQVNPQHALPTVDHGIGTNRELGFHRKQAYLAGVYKILGFPLPLNSNTPAHSTAAQAPSSSCFLSVPWCRSFTRCGLIFFITLLVHGWSFDQWCEHKSALSFCNSLVLGGEDGYSALRSDQLAMFLRNSSWWISLWLSSVS